ncbi:MAG: nuclear transport factor 2 family protein [Candidatus Acidiferrales bacterium]
MKRTVLAGATLIALLLGASGFAQQTSRTGNEREQVWAGEEAYWQYVKAHDAKNYMALWAKDFTGWPISDERPIHWSDIASFVTKKGSLTQVVSYELQRESVEMHGPAVITYYRAIVRRHDANGSESTKAYRMTHTWMKRGGRWQIVSGMSAMDVSPESESSTH